MMRPWSPSTFVPAPSGVQTTPKPSRLRESLTRAPCSLKQSANPREDEETNSDVLNVCCSGFNSLLFLTPPKIRSPAGATPSPGRQQEEAPTEPVLPKELLELLNADLDCGRAAHPAEVPDRGTALHNITNLETVLGEDEPTGKKRSGKSQFKFPDGGWVCLACQNYNFCGRVRCNRCGKVKTKDDPVGKPKHLLRKENDENDPTMAAKAPNKSAKKQLHERAGDWLCLSCRNINFAFRQQCNRCKLDKELIGSTLDGRGVGQTATWGVYPTYCPQTVPYGYAQYAVMMPAPQLAYPSGAL